MAPDAAPAKRRLRDELAARRRELPAEQARTAAEAVAAAALREPRLRAATRVGLYAAGGGELPTRPLFDALAALPLARLLPRVRGGVLEWAEAGRWEDLVPGRYGILEPTGPPEPAPGPGELVLLPGLAFDAAGWRLGRGGGHYDRAFPPGAPAPLLVGVGYAFQVVAAVPHDSRDRRLDAIVTERGFAWCTEAG